MVLAAGGRLCYFGSQDFHLVETGMDKQDTVRAVERALTLLELLAAEDALRLSDLAGAAGLPISTTHRLLVTLEKRGFVQAEPEGGTWAVGRRAFAVGAAFSRRHSYLAPAIHFLRRLRDATRETANLGAILSGEVTIIAQAESREITRAIAAPGGRTPVVVSAMGKAIASTWPDDAVDALIAQNGFRQMTARSIRDAGALKAELGLIRQRGYAVDDEEFVTGIRCVAAVVRDPFGEPACAISVSGMADRLPEARLPALGRMVIEHAAELSDRLRQLS